MNEKKETSSDIIREMRNLGKLDEKCGDMIPRSLQGLGLLTYADRIDAAVKREKAATEADALNVGGIVEATRHKSGNAAALRAALKNVLGICANCTCSADVCDRACKPGIAGKTIEKARAALSAPARNCDIYDAENGVAECMQKIDAAWHEIDTIRATIGWMLAPAEGGAK